MTITTQPSGTFDQITAGADSRKKEQASTADYQSFIKLLVSQMKYQDPLSPMDATQYVSQLASFSSLEQALKTNEKLDQLLTGSTVAQASNYIGKFVSNEEEKISGIVSSVKISNDGLIAILDNGKELSIGYGVTVSNTGVEAKDIT